MDNLCVRGCCCEFCSPGTPAQKTRVTFDLANRKMHDWEDKAGRDIDRHVNRQLRIFEAEEDA